MIPKEIIEKEIREFFEKMGFEAQVGLEQTQESVLSINVQTEEPQILIGERGETLSEIQYLLRMILRRKLGQTQELFYFDLDINDYKKKKIDYLKEVANKAAEEVLLTKEEKELPPMSSYERRVVHMALAEREGVISESRGEGQERRVVVKPRN